jgi:hypothetical protein
MPRAVTPISRSPFARSPFHQREELAAYSNRSYAFYLKGMYAQAHSDLEMAASTSPNARQVEQIRGMINERNLRPSVIMEDHR